MEEELKESHSFGPAFPPPARAERKTQAGTERERRGSRGADGAKSSQVSKDAGQTGTCLVLAASEAAATLGSRRIETGTRQVRACAPTLSDQPGG